MEPSHSGLDSVEAPACAKSGDLDATLNPGTGSFPGKVCNATLAAAPAISPTNKPKLMKRGFCGNAGLIGALAR